MTMVCVRACVCETDRAEQNQRLIHFPHTMCFSLPCSHFLPPSLAPSLILASLCLASHFSAVILPLHCGCWFRVSFWSALIRHPPPQNRLRMDRERGGISAIETKGGGAEKTSYKEGGVTQAVPMNMDHCATCDSLCLVANRILD